MTKMKKYYAKLDDSEEFDLISEFDLQQEDLEMQNEEEENLRQMERLQKKLSTKASSSLRHKARSFVTQKSVIVQPETNLSILNPMFSTQTKNPISISYQEAQLTTQPPGSSSEACPYGLQSQPMTKLAYGDNLFLCTQSNGKNGSTEWKSLHSEGYIDLSLVFGSTIELDSRSSLFRIIPKLSYDVEKVIAKIKRKKDRIIANRKDSTELNTALIARREREAEGNALVVDTIKTAIHLVKYGEIVQFQHVKSNKFMSVCPKLINDGSTLKMHLTDNPSDNAWFRIYPRIPNLYEDEFIYTGDVTMIQSAASKLHNWYCNTNNDFTLDLSHNPSSFQIAIHQKELVLDEERNMLISSSNFLCTGHGIRIVHSNSSLELSGSCKWYLADNTVTFNELERNDNIMQSTSNVYLSPSSVFIIENENHCQSGEFVKWNKKYLFRHVASNRYLTCCPNSKKAILTARSDMIDVSHSLFSISPTKGEFTTINAEYQSTRAFVNLGKEPKVDISSTPYTKSIDQRGKYSKKNKKDQNGSQYVGFCLRWNDADHNGRDLWLKSSSSYGKADVFFSERKVNEGIDSLGLHRVGCGFVRQLERFLSWRDLCNRFTKFYMLTELDTDLLKQEEMVLQFDSTLLEMIDYFNKAKAESLEKWGFTLNLTRSCELIDGLFHAAQQTVWKNVFVRLIRSRDLKPSDIKQTNQLKRYKNQVHSRIWQVIQKLVAHNIINENYILAKSLRSKTSMSSDIDKRKTFLSELVGQLGHRKGCFSLLNAMVCGNLTVLDYVLRNEDSAYFHQLINLVVTRGPRFSQGLKLLSTLVSDDSSTEHSAEIKKKRHSLSRFAQKVIGEKYYDTKGTSSQILHCIGTKLIVDEILVYYDSGEFYFSPDDILIFKSNKMKLEDLMWVLYPEVYFERVYNQSWSEFCKNSFRKNPDRWGLTLKLARLRNLAEFYLLQLELYTNLVSPGRNEPNKKKLRQEFPMALLVTGIKMEHQLPSLVRGFFVKLLNRLYIDVHPHYPILHVSLINFQVKLQPGQWGCTSAELELLHDVYERITKKYQIESNNQDYFLMSEEVCLWKNLVKFGIDEQIEQHHCNALSSQQNHHSFANLLWVVKAVRILNNRNPKTRRTTLSPRLSSEVMHLPPSEANKKKFNASSDGIFFVPTLPSFATIHENHHLFQDSLLDIRTYDKEDSFKYVCLDFLHLKAQMLYKEVFSKWYSTTAVDLTKTSNIELYKDAAELLKSKKNTTDNEMNSLLLNMDDDEYNFFSYSNGQLCEKALKLYIQEKQVFYGLHLYLTTSLVIPSEMHTLCNQYHHSLSKVSHLLSREQDEVPELAEILLQLNQYFISAEKSDIDNSHYILQEISRHFRVYDTLLEILDQFGWGNKLNLLLVLKFWGEMLVSQNRTNQSVLFEWILPSVLENCSILVEQQSEDIRRQLLRLYGLIFEDNRDLCAQVPTALIEQLVMFQENPTCTADSSSTGADRQSNALDVIFVILEPNDVPIPANQSLLLECLIRTRGSGSSCYSTSGAGSIEFFSATCRGRNFDAIVTCRRLFPFDLILQNLNRLTLIDCDWMNVSCAQFLTHVYFNSPLDFEQEFSSPMHMITQLKYLFVFFTHVFVLEEIEDDEFENNHEEKEHYQFAIRMFCESLNSLVVRVIDQKAALRQLVLLHAHTELIQLKQALISTNLNKYCFVKLVVDNFLQVFFNKDIVTSAVPVSTQPSQHNIDFVQKLLDKEQYFFIDKLFWKSERKQSAKETIYQLTKLLKLLISAIEHQIARQQNFSLISSTLELILSFLSCSVTNASSPSSRRRQEIIQEVMFDTGSIRMCSQLFFFIHVNSNNGATNHLKTSNFVRQVLKLGCFLLFDGVSRMQNRFYEAISISPNGLFFKSIRHIIHQVKEALVEERKTLQTLETSCMTLNNKDSGCAAQKNATATVVSHSRLLFRFLQLLCEGHHPAWQLAMRTTPPHVLEDISILEGCVSLFPLFVRAGLQYYEDLASLLEFFIEVCQGPSLKNQEFLVQTIVPDTCITLIDIEHFSSRNGHNSAQENHLSQLGVKVLLSLCGGRQDDLIHCQLAKLLLPNVIYTRLMQISVTDIDSNSVLAEEGYDLIRIVYSLVSLRHKDPRCQKFAKEWSALRNSGSTSGDDPITTLEGNLCTVEISWGGSDSSVGDKTMNLEKIYFPRPPESLFLTNEMKENLEFQMDFSSENPLDFFLIAPEAWETMVELKTIVELKNNGFYQWYYKHYTNLRCAIFFVSLVLNFSILLLLTTEKNSIEPYLLGPHRIFIICGGTILLVVCLINFMGHITKQYMYCRRSLDQHNQHPSIGEKDPRKPDSDYSMFWHTFRCIVSVMMLVGISNYAFGSMTTNPFASWWFLSLAVLFVFLAVAFDLRLFLQRNKCEFWGAKMYLLFYFLFSNKIVLLFAFYICTALAGMVGYYYLFSLTLLDIMANSTTLMNVTKAVTTPYKDLSATAALCLITIYIFTIIGYFIFPKDIDVANTCSSLRQCYLIYLHNGLLSGGGIGDYLSDALSHPPNTKMPNAFVERTLYDLAYFIVIIVLLLNIVFGIIIDNFGKLREDDEERARLRKSKCVACNIPRERFDNLVMVSKYSDTENKNGFKHHVMTEHNMWDFFLYIVYLLAKDKNVMNGAETEIRDKIHKKDSSWIPKQALTLLNQK